MLNLSGSRLRRHFSCILSELQLILKIYDMYGTSNVLQSVTPDS